MKMKIDELPWFGGYKSLEDKEFERMQELTHAHRWLPPRDVEKDGFPLNPEECDTFANLSDRTEDGHYAIVYDGEKWCRVPPIKHSL